MAVTTTYSINTLIDEFTANTFHAGSQWSPAVAVLNNGDFIVTYESVSGFNAASILDEQFDNDGVRAPGSWDLVNSTTTGAQRDSKVAALDNGGYVVVFSDTSLGTADRTIRFRLFDDNGVALGSDVNIGVSGSDEYGASVATLADGRFIVTWTLRSPGSFRGDIYRAVYNEDGTVSLNATPVTSGSTTINHVENEVAALADGGYVVAYWQEDAAIVGYNAAIRARIYNSDNTLRATVAIGNTSLEPHVIGLSDGRWAIVYQDRSWGTGKSDITLAIYNANGSMSSAPVRANAVVGNGQWEANIAELGAGFLLVTWTHDSGSGEWHIKGRVFASNGTAVTNEFSVEQSFDGQMQSRVAGGLNGRFMVTYTDLQTSGPDTSDWHIGAQLSELQRNSVGDAAADTIIGDTLRDVMIGNGGNDFLDGRGQNDVLDGGNGNDRLKGGDGDDVLIGGAGNDTIRGNTDNDRANGGPGNDYILGGHGEDLLSGGDGGDSINGQTGSDTLNGGGGNDTLLGGFQNDTLNGGPHNDYLNGGSADDVLNGSSGSDTIIGSTGHDRLFGGSGNDVLKAGNGNDTLKGGADSDLLAGGLHSDTLVGDTGNDTLQGQSGLDLLIGGAGSDVLIGGSNADTFVFAKGFGPDTINDFSVDQDTLQLNTNLWVGTLTAQQVVNSFASVVGNNTILDFNGSNDLTVKGIANPNQLVDDIIIV